MRNNPGAVLCHVYRWEAPIVNSWAHEQRREVDEKTSLREEM